LEDEEEEVTVKFEVLILHPMIKDY